MDPATWLDECGDALFTYALMRVLNQETAEDLVQETLLAAIQTTESFKEQSSEKTWLIGILKHKIIDYIRKASREVLMEKDILEEQLNSGEHFNTKGHWQTEVHAWSLPDKSLENEKLWDALNGCINQLPKRLATFFMLREMDGLGTEELCSVLDITPNNVWTTLSRVRMKMRECLDVCWFNTSRMDQNNAKLQRSH